MIGKLKDWMKEKGKESEKEKVKAEILFSMPVVVFYVIHLVFKGVKTFIFYFPAAPGSFDHCCYIFLSYRIIGNPAAFIINFFISLFIF